MHVSIERSGCISCGLCASTCPEVFRIGDDGTADLLYSAQHDMRNVDRCTTYSFGVRTTLPAGGSVALHEAQSRLTCGTGQADPQIIQYKDGTPLIILTLPPHAAILR